MTAVHPSRPTTFLTVSLLLTLLGYVIRLHNLGGDSLWIDEMLTLNVIEKGVEAIFNQNDHPPLFYLITAPFIQLFGDSEFALRLSPFLAGVLSLPLIILFGKQIGRSEAGLWAALLLALSPFHLKHSQDARHYTWLMAFSLITFILLYRALKRPSWRTWLSFTLATALNLYTHYSAFIILAMQSLIIAIWLAKQWWQKNYHLTRYALTAAFILILLYLPWLPQLQHALNRNIGEEIVKNNRQVVPLSNWVTTTYNAFNQGPPFLPPLLLGLGLIGLLYWAWQRNWLGAGMILAGLTLPFILISTFDVARVPQPRYTIYMLPLYLLFVGNGIVALITPGRQWPSGVWFSGVVLVIMGFAAIYVPLLSQEYTFVLNDWRTALTYVSEKAEEQAVIVEMSLNYPTGYNIVPASLPYYTEKLQTDYVHIPGNRVTFAEAAALAQTEAQAFGVVMYWGRPFQFNETPMQVQPVQSDIYVLHGLAQTDNALVNTIDFYQQLIPYAQAPSPQCLLQRDLAILATADQQWQTAEQAYNQAASQCPHLADDKELPLYEIYRGLMTQHLAEGQIELAHHYATNILQQVNANDHPALEILEVENLLQQYQRGDATVAQNGSPEPVRLAEFVMPGSGDTGEVLFMHPPTAVSYQLTLPADPTALFFRMAMAPESWHWGGDGTTFIITLQQNDEPPAKLFRQHIGNEPEDRRWHNGTVSLSAYAGESVTVTFTTDSGPAGDGTGDWAGWDTPRLIWEASPP